MAEKNCTEHITVTVDEVIVVKGNSCSFSCRHLLGYLDRNTIFAGGTRRDKCLLFRSNLRHDLADTPFRCQECLDAEAKGAKRC